jgi:hypothetical protein
MVLPPRAGGKLEDEPTDGDDPGDGGGGDPGGGDPGGGDPGDGGDEGTDPGDLLPSCSTSCENSYRLDSLVCDLGPEAARPACQSRAVERRA